jgi:tetratricopeptide (TPR) repeat protein
MSEDFRLNRDRSVLADGMLFGRRRRPTPRWKIGAVLLVLAIIGFVIWQFEAIQPRVMAFIGVGPTPAPSAAEFFRRGDLAFKLGDLNTAISNYRQAAELVPGNPDILVELARMLLYRSYDDARNDADIIEGLQWSSQAVELNPQHARAHTINCFALIRAGKSEEALAICRRAIDLNPQDADPHAYLSMAYYDLNRVSEALEEGGQAVKLNDQSIDAHMAYGQALASRRQFDIALEHYQRATQINKRLEFPYFNLAFLAYTVALNRSDQGKFILAIDTYNTVLSINSRSAKAYTRLCYTYMANGEWNLARDNCKTATTIDPAFTSGWRWLGEVYYRTMDYENAIIAFEECAKLESALPNDKRQVECWSLRGLAHIQDAKDCAKAMPIFNDVLAWASDQETIRLTRIGIDLCAGGGSVAPTQVSATAAPPKSQ